MESQKELEALAEYNRKREELRNIYKSNMRMYRALKEALELCNDSQATRSDITHFLNTVISGESQYEGEADTVPILVKPQ